MHRWAAAAVCAVCLAANPFVNVCACRTESGLTRRLRAQGLDATVDLLLAAGHDCAEGELHTLNALHARYMARAPRSFASASHAAAMNAASGSLGAGPGPGPGAGPGAGPVIEDVIKREVAIMGGAGGDEI